MNELAVEMAQQPSINSSDKILHIIVPLMELYGIAVRLGLRRNCSPIVGLGLIISSKVGSIIE
jgi:hypothetical protein